MQKLAMVLRGYDGATHLFDLRTAFAHDATNPYSLERARLAAARPRLPLYHQN